MIDPDVAATACPNSPSSPNIIDPCPTSKASRDEAGDDPQDCALSGAQGASGSTSGTMDQSISPRSHGAEEASVDAVQDDKGDGPRSSPNIAGGVHVAADDPRPFRVDGEIAHASTHADADRLEPDAQAEDDQRWIETVLDSLRTRSPATREALAKALSDGSGTVTGVGHVSGLEHNPRKTAKNEPSKANICLDQSTPHVSGTTTFSHFPVGFEGFPAKVRSPDQAKFPAERPKSGLCPFDRPKVVRIISRNHRLERAQSLIVMCE